MKFTWDPLKDTIIRQSPGRNGIGFEDIVDAIESGQLRDIIDHPDQQHYAGQYILLVEVDAYIYHVPYREIDGVYHLITLYPSRKSTKKYL